MTYVFFSVDSLQSQRIDSSDEEVSTDLLFWNVTGSPSQDQLFDGFQNVSFKSSHSQWSTLLNLEDCRNSEEVPKIDTTNIYSGNPKTGHSTTRNIQKLDIFEVGFLKALVFEWPGPE